ARPMQARLAGSPSDHSSVVRYRMPAPVTDLSTALFTGLTAGLVALIAAVPAILGALVLLILGWILSGIVAGLIARGLRVIGVAAPLIQILFAGIVASLALAFGLAFGLGGREEAAALWRGWRGSVNVPQGQEMASSASSPGNGRPRTEREPMIGRG